MRPRVRQTSVAGSKRDVDVNTEMTKFLISALKWCLISKKPVDIPGTFLTMLWLLKRLSWSRDVISTWIGSKQSNKLGCTLTMSWCRNCRWLEWEGLGDLRWYVFTRSCLKTRFQLDPKKCTKWNLRFDIFVIALVSPLATLGNTWSSRLSPRRHSRMTDYFNELRLVRRLPFWETCTPKQLTSESIFELLMISTIWICA